MFADYRRDEDDDYFERRDSAYYRYREHDDFLEWHADELKDPDYSNCGVCDMCWSDPFKFMELEFESEWWDDKADSVFRARAVYRRYACNARYSRRGFNVRLRRTDGGKMRRTKFVTARAPFRMKLEGKFQRAVFRIHEASRGKLLRPVSRPSRQSIRYMVDFAQ